MLDFGFWIELPTEKATLSSGFSYILVFDHVQNFVTPGTGILYHPSASGRLWGTVSQV
jgi:hypothetical protein